MNNDSVQSSPPPAHHHAGTVFEVLRAFLALGFTSFGGPVAHIGYFRTEFVTRRRWLDEREYADLVALSQFLPGPASSKLGFSLGLLRAGYLGGLAAWVGFTLPSALLLVLFAMWAGSLADVASGQALIHGLKLVAVVVVAHAVLGMARNLCPDRQRSAIAVLALAIALLAPKLVGQMTAICAGAVLGLLLCRSDSESVPPPLKNPVRPIVGIVAIVVFAGLLALAFVPNLDGAAAMFSAFYRSGALVFGGGHVVLPLLDEAVVKTGWVEREAFLAGYGATQAVPGPLFTIASYLGFAAGNPVSGWSGATLALIAIFLPGILLQLAALPFWNAFRGRPLAQAGMRGVNAAVVGILGAALYTPVWTSGVLGVADVAVVVLGFVLLVAWKAPPMVVVAVVALVGAAAHLLGAG
jgi:chromate transporter